MLETLQYIDAQWFEAVNGLAIEWLDPVIVFIRNKKSWIPLYIIIILYTIYRFKKQSIAVIIMMILTIVLADQISASIIKPFFERLRPCQADSVRLLVKCGTGKSFVSSHATNHFALAVFWLSFFKWKRYLNIATIFWAAAICFAQVYVGVHYPFDVICGALLGISIGLLMTYLTNFLFQKLKWEK